MKVGDLVRVKDHTFMHPSLQQYNGQMGMVVHIGAAMVRIRLIATGKMVDIAKWRVEEPDDLT